MNEHKTGLTFIINLFTNNYKVNHSSFIIHHRLLFPDPFPINMTQSALLDRLEADLRALLEQVRTDIAPLEANALQFRPVPEQWNVLECFAHLNAFADQYLPRIEQAIHRAKARKWTPGEDIVYTFMGRRDIRRATPLNGKKIRTRKRYDFMYRPYGKEVVKNFIIQSERILRNLQMAKEVDLNKAKVPRGESGFFSYTLGNTFEWLVIHTQRHIAQMVEILAQVQVQKSAMTR